MARSLVASPRRWSQHGSEPCCEPSEVVSTWFGALLRALVRRIRMAWSLVASPRHMWGERGRSTPLPPSRKQGAQLFSKASLTSGFSGKPPRWGQ